MNNKGKHISEKDYLRYLGNEMNDAGRNAFEKELQKQPFEAEAIEGLQRIGSEKLEADLKDLHDRLLGKNNAGRRTMWWAAAAAVVVLTTSTILWVQLSEQSNAPQVAENLVKESKGEMASPEKEALQAHEGIKSEKKPGDENKSAQKKGTPDKSPAEIPPSALKEIDEETTPAGVPKEVRDTKEAEPVTTENIADSGKNNEPQMSNAGQADLIYQLVEEDIEIAFEIADEEESAILCAGNTELKNVVTASQSSGRESIAGINQKAMPMMDEKAFEKYLQSKALLPKDYPKNMDTLTLLIKINQAGEISEMTNIYQANPELFEKGREIIRSGPAWQPALINGFAIASELELEIIFRK